MCRLIPPWRDEIDPHDTKRNIMKNKRSFARSASASSRKPSFRRGSNSSVGRKFTKNTGRPKRNFSNKRRGFSSSHIDYSKFIKKAELIKEKEYVSKNKFSDFPFTEQLHKNIIRKGFTSPKPIQDQAIPSVLLGKDVFGLANTGTGKTAAFLLPLIEKVNKNKTEKVIIMAPTRELAMQIENDFRDLAFGLSIFSVSCVGGMPITKQIREIQRGVSFVIGTPGRIKDLINRKVLDLTNYHSVVLDEADRMLDMGFKDEMVYILAKMSKERQTLFFSATLSPEIKKLTSEFLKEPIFISVISGETAKNIEQNVVRVKTKDEKIERLNEILKKDGTDKVLIFRERKHSVDDLAKELSVLGFKVGGIHGDKRSRDRIRILESFKKDSITILIATDVAARGLDIPDVSHVINYDIPQNYETYIHRIGRTGRAGKSGIALTFILG